ncbi:MAG: hypothetical protein H5T43_05460 [Methanomethylovorans sp.]|nr:hypothetical protein [Methanomethylovorans sp.]
MMEKFIADEMLGRTVSIYCGGIATFKGTVRKCEDGFVQLEITQGRYTSIAINKIITITALTGMAKNC